MSSLKEWGFEVNPYNWCVTNIRVDGKQMTLVWHVDNLKIPHVNEDAVDALISHINEWYIEEAEITIHQKKLHDYLGMNKYYR